MLLTIIFYHILPLIKSQNTNPVKTKAPLQASYPLKFSPFYIEKIIRRMNLALFQLWGSFLIKKSGSDSQQRKQHASPEKTGLCVLSVKR
jgi:hypothetical protein